MTVTKVAKYCWPVLLSLFLFIQIPYHCRAQAGFRHEFAELDPDHYTGQYAVKEGSLALWNGRMYLPFFIKGINLGVSVPGTQPGELAATREDYRRWFDLVKRAGYNAIRLYTLHYPRFYEELAEYNRQHPENPLLVLQGIWLEEEVDADDLFNLTLQFGNEIREVVRAVHGDIVIGQRFGKAFGTFDADVSPWVLAYIAGREIFPDEVASTNQAHPEVTGYQGSYLSLEGGGDPLEAWIVERLDSLVAFEKQRYGSVRPVGFTNWPTLDPLIHPTEQLIDGSHEDEEKIDLSNVVASESSGGFFMAFHAYPYYPDFIVQDPEYRMESDRYGPNSYLGYLKDLKAHYRNVPLIVAEFGVPSSWGSGHLSPAGMHHGGLTEEEQAHLTIRMLENIREADYAGGIQFSLIDEWFKQTWITNPFSDAAFRHFWHNITAPEQNFGILSFAPPPEPFEEAGTYQGEDISRIEFSSDYTFFRIRLYMDSEAHLDDTLWVALDTYAPELGESVLPGGLSIGDGGDTLRAEFALRIPVGGERADLFVIPSYDVYGVKQEVRLDTLVSLPTDRGIWNRVRWKTNYFYNITQYIGKLGISRSSDPYQFLNAVTVFNDSLEIRLPWTLINYYAPSVRRAIHYVSYLDGSDIVIQQRDTLTQGIAMTVAMDRQLYRTGRYSWNFWDHEKIGFDPPLERKKQSYHILERELMQFNNPPVGFPDTFSIFPGARLEIDAAEGLLSNDLDMDGNVLQANLSFGGGPKNGDLFLHPDGSFNYIPEEGFRGDDFFMYFLDDGFDQSTLIPVTIGVNFPLGEMRKRTGAENNRFRIDPNPGSGPFRISSLQKYDQAMLYITDVTGRLLQSLPLMEESTRIDLGEADEGVYLFVIQVDRELEVHKIIVH